MKTLEISFFTCDRAEHFYGKLDGERIYRTLTDDEKETLVLKDYCSPFLQNKDYDRLIDSYPDTTDRFNTVFELIKETAKNEKEFEVEFRGGKYHVEVLRDDVNAAAGLACMEIKLKIHLTTHCKMKLYKPIDDHKIYRKKLDKDWRFGHICFNCQCCDFYTKNCKVYDKNIFKIEG